MEREKDMPAIRLSIGAIVRDAFVIPWNNRRRMLQALSMLIIALSAIAASQSHSLEHISVGLIVRFFLLTVILSILYAVTCHRLILLGNDSVPRHGLWKWTFRETRFLGWILAVAVIYALVCIPVVVILLGFSTSLSYTAFDWFLVGATIPPAYVPARFSLVFPATAIDEWPRPNLEWSWRASRGNGWRLVLIIAVFPIVLSLAGFLLRDGATLVEVILVYTLGYVLLAVEITALSLSYKLLSENVDSGILGEGD